MQVQSFLSTFMKMRLGVYECRIFLKIVERCQDLVKGGTFAQRAYQVPAAFGYLFSFPLHELSPSNNYHYVKEACKRLESVIAEYYEFDRKTWYSSGLIKMAVIDERTGHVTIEVAPWIVKQIIDFRHGWVTYDLAKVIKLRNPHAMRLYLLTCCMSTPLHYNVATIKRLLLGNDAEKYRNNGDFIRRIVMKSRDDLKAAGLNSFTVELKKENGKKTGRLQQVILKPAKQEMRAKNVGQIKQEIEQSVPPICINYLIHQCGFTTKELGGKNKALLQKFCSRDEWQVKLVQIVERARKHRYGHGYVINAIKSELASK